MPLGHMARVTFVHLQLFSVFSCEVCGVPVRYAGNGPWLQLYPTGRQIALELLGLLR